jgi:hypothetical protein
MCTILHQRPCLPLADRLASHLFPCFLSRLRPPLWTSVVSLVPPPEVLLGICTQADAVTLAQLCRVSFSMLLIASPVLYRDIHLKTEKSLYKVLLKVSWLAYIGKLLLVASSLIFD